MGSANGIGCWISADARDDVDGGRRAVNCRRLERLRLRNHRGAAKRRELTPKSHRRAAAMHTARARTGTQDSVDRRTMIPDICRTSFSRCQSPSPLDIVQPGIPPLPMLRWTGSLPRTRCLSAAPAASRRSCERMYAAQCANRLGGHLCMIRHLQFVRHTLVSAPPLVLTHVPFRIKDCVLS